ncbi:CPBP family intramembrane metalloprotease [Microbacterium sp. STN6]|uniref:CPBP family intramembrane glutamic endopeptidase n=1 Tax=Microbacterium sp. STN6 TaxID=2995588 RepID=UPI0022609505|nr:CPBP family intramembrane glutamic endopeptidase [Microbacterium sp. STN6]MCX7522686.1 CPBP family intramembrane metalloprotease [Microbacterium sp. STN6]
MNTREDIASDLPGTPPARSARLRRVLAHPLVWMLIGIVAIVAVDAVCTGVGSLFGWLGTILGALLGGALAIVLYRLVMRRLAGRPTPELTLEPRPAARGALLGAAIGAGFVVVSVALVALLGGYTVAWHPVDAARTVALVVAVNIGAAVVEELVFRGLALQAIERLGGGRRLGQVLAVAITAAFFGGAHLLNPGATLWSGFAIAVEAGLLTGAAFLWKRNLWLVIGLHAAWNILEGLLGIAVSGHRDPGLFVTTAHGPAILSGGTFGLEASIVPVLVGIAIAVPMLIAARRRA